MDFEKATFEDLDQQAIQQMVFSSDEISQILKGHLFIEKILEVLISKTLHNPKALFSKNRSFELKIDLAKAMGLIQESHFSCFKALNIIRNNYAHRANYEVSFEEISSLKLNWEPLQHQAFAKACEKGIAEATKIAMLFLCWSSIRLIKNPDE